MTSPIPERVPVDEAPANFGSRRRYRNAEQARRFELDLAVWNRLPSRDRIPLAGALVAALRRTAERRYRNERELERAIAAAVRSWAADLDSLADLLAGLEARRRVEP